MNYWLKGLLVATTFMGAVSFTPVHAQEFEMVDTETVTKALEDENSVVIDARSNDIFIGWQLENEARGGHIPGATDFSADWLSAEYDDKENLEGETREQVLEQAMETKNIGKDTNIIIYDTNGEDAKKVAQYFAGKDIQNISLYDANEWVKDSSKELESYPNYQLLLAPEVLNKLIEGESVEGIPSDKLVILDVSWGSEEESGYLDGHIPGAYHINTDSFEPPMEYVKGIEEWRLTDAPTLEKLLLDNGITKDTTVITTGPEPMAASRMAVILKYMGVEHVHVLNGGLVNWKNAGFELETQANKPEKATDFGAEVPVNKSLIISKDQMLDEIKNNDQLELLDVRTQEEFDGKISGYSYHDKTGRLPKAKYAHAGKKNSSSMSFYRNIDKTIRNKDELLKMWQDTDIDTNKDLVVYCGSGWRAAETLWYANVYGIDNIRLFSDGWIAWSNEGYPVEDGIGNAKTDKKFLEETPSEDTTESGNN